MSHRVLGKQFRVEHHPVSRSVYAYLGEQHVGTLLLNEDHSVREVSVHPDHRRKGIATAMVEHANANGMKVNGSESSIRTDDGEALALKMGAPPRRYRAVGDYDHRYVAPPLDVVRGPQLSEDDV